MDSSDEKTNDDCNSLSVFLEKFLNGALVETDLAKRVGQFDYIKNLSRVARLYLLTQDIAGINPELFLSIRRLLFTAILVPNSVSLKEVQISLFALETIVQLSGLKDNVTNEIIKLMNSCSGSPDSGSPDLGSPDSGSLNKENEK